MPDGKDAEGNQKYKTALRISRFDGHFTNGTVHVEGDYGDSECEQGFKISMMYNDGVGVEVGGSNAGARHHKSQSFGSEAMGVDHKDYHMTSKA